MPFPVDLYPRGVATPIRANASDLSLEGCYVKMLFSPKLGADLRIVLWIGCKRIEMKGVVQCSDPGVGIGIKFVPQHGTGSAELKDSGFGHEQGHRARPANGKAGAGKLMPCAVNLFRPTRPFSFPGGRVPGSGRF